MKRLISSSVAIALLVAGCAARTPAPTPPPAPVLAPAPTPAPAPAPGQSEGLAPYAIAFWDEQKGLIAGQAGCPVRCGDYVIALTEDGGVHWREVYRGAERVGELAVVPGGAWASTAQGLLRSTDGGRTWQATASGYAVPTFAGASVGWALTATEGNRWNIEGPIYATQDGGATWKPLVSPCTGNTAGTAAIHLVSETEGWAGCVGQPGAGQQKKVLFRTTDGGVTWQEATLDFGGYLNGIFFRPGGRGWMWLGRGVPGVTANGGRSWQWLDTFQPESRDVWDIWMLTDQTGYLLVRDNNDPRHFKLMKTTDGAASATLVTQWPIDPPR
ncbi:MAG TPA: hypothetical protein VD969_07965 [Symbiobacteriaceae bacterium]|nr:hypothetical protein [Symbiobacteriaceae bacterium]